MQEIRKIAIVANRAKSGLDALAAELAQVANANGVEVVLPLEHPLRAGALQGCDACAILGGDGTLLGVVQEAATCGIPVFGINRGKLGFLANYPSDDAANSLLAVLRGEYQISKRLLLECSFDNSPRWRLALNDVVIQPRFRNHMVNLRACVDGEFVNSFLCDGLIVSTPTGSTAYNLSAGGPLLAPDAEVFTLTPVCPHTLSNRSMIFPAGRSLEIASEKATTCTGLCVAVDGVEALSQEGALTLRVRTSQTRLSLLQPIEFSHFALLRDKLRWV